jgi:hypothetical protein
LYRCKSLDDERDWQARENPPPPGRYTTFSTPALDRVVVKALAFAREQRYATALEFRAALLAAEPSASQVDAPMFAALMRTMLGSKLEKLRAALPSEVSQALARDAEATTARARSVEGLTAAIGSSDDVGNSYEHIEPTMDDASEEPTAIASSATEVSRLEMLPVLSTLEGLSDGEPGTGPTLLYTGDGARAPTEPAATFLIATPRPVMRPGQLWMLRTAVGMVCLAVGIAAGALVSGVAPRPGPALASGAAAAGPSVTPPQAATPRLIPASENSEPKPAALAPPPEPAPAPSANTPAPHTQRPVAAPIARNKRGATGKAGAAKAPLRASKLSKGSSAGGRKGKSPLTRKLKNAVR